MKTEVDVRDEQKKGARRAVAWATADRYNRGYPDGGVACPALPVGA
ncbi:MAG: hypothetical protein ACM3JB_08485 [Acidobacteriaceae bacterium]